MRGKQMKKIISLLLMTGLISLCLFAGCANSDSGTDSNTFTVGEEVRSSITLPWQMHIDTTSSVSTALDTDMVTITEYVLTANRAADMTEIEDLRYGYQYYRYIYDAKIIGNLDVKFSNMRIYIYASYKQEVASYQEGKSGTIINSDGSFIFNFYIYSNEPVTDFTPYRIMIYPN
jgi:hypothetical protein